MNGSDQQRRTFIAIGLTLALTLIYTIFFGPKPPQPPAIGNLVLDAGMASAPAPPPVAPRPVPVAPAEPERPRPPTIEFKQELPLVHYQLSTAGGGLLQAELQGQKMREQLRLGISEGFSRLIGGRVAQPPQMDMGRPIPNQPLPLTISIEGPLKLPADTAYSYGSALRAVSFTASVTGWEVRKRLEWNESGEEFSYEISLRNTTSAEVTSELGIHYARAVDPQAEEKPSYFGGVGNLSSAVCSVGNDVRRLVPDEKPPTEYNGPLHFVGIDQQYFLAAIYPKGEARAGRCVLTATPTGRSVVAYFPLKVGPGETVIQRFGGFIGPKDFELLSSVGSGSAEKVATDGSPYLEKTVKVATDNSPHLEKTVDLGIWAFICKVLLWILKFFHAVTGNWGVAIIGLTLVVKVVLLPLTHKMMVSGEAMKKLQPKVEAIRKKYAEDKEKQNLEIMKVYQEAKVNPLSGCLPLLIQMPVWFALFTTLRTTYEIYGEPFIRPLWLDLTYKDPTYILPAALGVTMIVTQKLQPQMGAMDATQAKIMTYVMPILFTALMMNYPAGLSLYIFTNNVLTIAQQHLLRKYLESKGVATPQEKRK